MAIRMVIVKMVYARENSKLISSTERIQENEYAKNIKNAYGFRESLPCTR